MLKFQSKRWTADYIMILKPLGGPINVKNVWAMGIATLKFSNVGRMREQRSTKSKDALKNAARSV